MTAVCAREGCEVEYTKSTHNQKYCTSECCRIATNAKIMKRYYENKWKRSGAKRYCECGAKLSRYNMTDKCAKCVAADNNRHKDEIANMMSNVVFK